MAFETTRWSIVQRAGLGAEESSGAMEELCQAYWKPLFVYLRRRGYSRDAAEEELQSFFLVFLEKNYVMKADAELGRFRTYIITALNRFLSKSAEKSNTQKRGKNIVFVRIDLEEGESLLEQLGSSELSPEAAFERQWAYSILNQALAQLDLYYARIRKQTLYEKIKPILASPGMTVDYNEVAENLAMTQSALRVAVHRMKTRYRDCIMEIIEDTVASPEDIESELHHLMDAVSGS